MSTELRKKFEEAAKKIADKKFPCHRASENVRRAREDYQLCRDSCIIGIEYGYKEAIKVAKEWLNENASRYASYAGMSNQLLIDFENGMKNFWEEKK